MKTSKKILILGNMANDGYAVAKEMKKMGVDVTLAINNLDFGMSMPEWEEAEFDEFIDPYDENRKSMKKYWKSPDWIRYFDFKLCIRPWKLPKRFNESIKIRKIIREYDIVESHVPYPIISQFSGVPYYVYEAGWIRHFEKRRRIVDILGERGYNKSKGVMITNPDTLRIVDTLPTLRKDNIFFTPFAIDSEHYKPEKKINSLFDFMKEEHFIVLAPARQLWNTKGNDKYIKAFARFTKINPNARLLSMLWSEDASKSLALCASLGISDKIIWLPPLPKKSLIKLFNASDVVLDQFILGSWGTLTPEAMSCEKPVLMYYNEEYIKRTFGEIPPILNSFSEEDILNNLIVLQSEEKRIQIGKESREWIKKTHDPRRVAQKHLDILQGNAEPIKIKLKK